MALKWERGSLFVLSRSFAETSRYKTPAFCNVPREPEKVITCSPPGRVSICLMGVVQRKALITGFDSKFIPLILSVLARSSGILPILSRGIRLMLLGSSM